MSQPLFTDEGPQFYGAAYAHNAPFATGGPYQTPLTPQEEAAFRQWVATKGVPFDPTENPTDYDMRGYWKATGGKDWNGPGSHFPDMFKTPYDTTFSKESKYATANCPFVWKDDDHLVDSRNGQLIYGPALARPAASMTPAHGYNDTWHLEAVSADGSRRVVEATINTSSSNATTWDVELRPGETLEVKTSGNVTVA